MKLKITIQIEPFRKGGTGNKNRKFFLQLFEGIGGGRAQVFARETEFLKVGTLDDTFPKEKQKTINDNQP